MSDGLKTPAGPGQALFVEHFTIPPTLKVDALSALRSSPPQAPLDPSCHGPLPGPAALLLERFQAAFNFNPFARPLIDRLAEGASIKEIDAVTAEQLGFLKGTLRLRDEQVERHEKPYRDGTKLRPIRAKDPDIEALGPQRASYFRRAAREHDQVLDFRKLLAELEVAPDRDRILASIEGATWRRPVAEVCTPVGEVVILGRVLKGDGRVREHRTSEWNFASIPSKDVLILRSGRRTEDLQDPKRFDSATYLHYQTGLGPDGFPLAGPTSKNAPLLTVHEDGRVVPGNGETFERFFSGVALPACVPKHHVRDLIHAIDHYLAGTLIADELVVLLRHPSLEM
ncbi:MAG: hypothetical protein IT384_10220 [Deltaproteobacteria bacterium]|nr:hypothetical protein [Deltaproteobacteria bacterium]